jgi:hypothetical protein
MGDVQRKITSIEDPKQGLSNVQIKHFFSLQNIPYRELTFTQIPTSKFIQAVVFSGFEKNSLNGGNDHHWLYFLNHGKDKFLFDSYGDKHAYDDSFLKTNNIKFINKHRLQEWGTNTCGEYVCSFADFLNNQYNPTQPFEPNHFIQDFLDQFKFTHNHKENDTIVKDYYNQIIKRKQNPEGPTTIV